jgi:hypothetical protein
MFPQRRQVDPCRGIEGAGKLPQAGFEMLDTCEEIGGERPMEGVEESTPESGGEGGGVKF